MKPTTMNKVRNKQVLIWLDYGLQTNDTSINRYSLTIQRMLDDTAKKGVGISFFNEFREVMSFIKSIYNIIPKIMMSTTKNVRVVVKVTPVGSRTSFEV